MPYKVEYRTDEYPTGLPEGAKVEKVSSLPLVMTPSHEDSTHHDMRVEKSIITGSAYLSFHGVAHLTRDETRRLIEALQETIDVNQVPPGVNGLRDEVGDFWRRNHDGTYTFVNDEGKDHRTLRDLSLAHVEDRFGPVTHV